MRPKHLFLLLPRASDDKDASQRRFRCHSCPWTFDTNELGVCMDVDDLDPSSRRLNPGRGYNTEASSAAKSEESGYEGAEMQGDRENVKKLVGKDQAKESVQGDITKFLVPDESTNIMPLILNITSSALTGLSSMKAQHPKPCSGSRTCCFKRKDPKDTSKYLGEEADADLSEIPSFRLPECISPETFLQAIGNMAWRVRPARPSISFNVFEID
ncbi:hypothetical protein C8J56DRAFT_1063938 [Mycena floridula]|nr:hypothetical protein C8J56DRAFT_1063938 [Mycena floridula]